MKIRRLKSFQLELVSASILVIVVVGGLALTIAAAPRVDSDTGLTEEASSRTRTSDAEQLDTTKQTPVVLTPSKEMEFEESLAISGSIQAKHFALVSARIPGTLDAVFVDEGDTIKAGETKLFQTDSLKLSKAVAIARQDLTVAECAVQEKNAMLEKSLAVKSQANNDLKRFRDLLRNNATAIQEVEKAESHYKQCEADVKHTGALIDLANAQLEQAKLNVTIAEKDMDDSLVVSPICGQVSKRLCEPGEMAAAGTPVLKIEDLSLLEVSVYLPSEFYSRVVPGETEMRVHVGDTDLGLRPVSYKSPTVDNKLRTFKVEGLIESPPPSVVPGCLADVTIVSNRRTGVGVPIGSIQTRGNRAVVFTVQNNQVSQVNVETGWQANGLMEIVSGLAAGTPVVSMGQTFVEAGSRVSVVQEQAQ
ncbi:Multidrug resistance protein MdtA precursor [Planctomycetes bacterium CA13]|uniref:Multidrug resistance protein MdtA n=1 Tax=Novipirellula herctigrandis TaxID=2527986 RepID=A0A5C5YZU1_9BACT|nr:Multidrug resistance protein MdtA precursor [Planctomycetes bacterium CA13]